MKKTEVEVSDFLQEIIKIKEAAQKTDDGNRCMVSPSPELQEEISKEIAKLKSSVNNSILADRVKIGGGHRTSVGMNDGLIFPGTMYPVGTPTRTIQQAAANRAPLSGTVRVVVVLAQFSDKAMVKTKAHFEQLFFSLGSISTGSVREYYREVTNGTVDIQGEVVGPFTLPDTLAHYAHGESGTGSALPNARTMAKDAAVAANPSVNFGIYDNDGNGFVDAFIVIHAGSGGEQTGSGGDIWSHKWVLPSAMNVDGKQIYAYLTVPEDCKIGVCAHELGHLLFGFPDLYDTDGSSEGVGNWCLMGGGSWNNGGLTPAHPSAWCKAQQNWISVVNQTTNALVSIQDVKASRKAFRLWKNGAMGSEYFLVENRQKTGFDKHLPNGGLCIWHIDDSTPDNTNENRYKVGLVQADGLKQLEGAINRGDKGDVYPGSTNNTVFDDTSTPNSKSYAGAKTCVAVKNISAAGATMTAQLNVKCVVKPAKEIVKDKLEKDLLKDKREKEFVKEQKEFIHDKSLVTDKFKDKFEKELVEKPVSEKGFNEGKLGDGKFADKVGEGGGGFGNGGGLGGGVAPSSGTNLEERLANLEARMSMIEPFISEDLRPDLNEGALRNEDDYV